MLGRLNAPLPSNIKPWRIGILTEEMDGLFAFRRKRINPDEIATGDIRILEGQTLFDLDQSTEFPQHYIPAITGDSGGAIFVVLNGEPILLGTIYNGLSQGTAAGLHVNEVLDFAPSVEFFDLSTFEPPVISIDVEPPTEDLNLGSTQSDELKRICESIRTIEDLLDSGATSVTQDGQTVVFDRKDARKRLRQLQQRKLDLEAAASGTGRRAKRRRPLLNRIDLSGY